MQPTNPVKIYSLGSGPGTNLVNVAYRPPRADLGGKRQRAIHAGPTRSESAFSRLGWEHVPNRAHCSVAALAGGKEELMDWHRGWAGSTPPQWSIHSLLPPGSERSRYVRSFPDRDNRLWVGHTEESPSSALNRCYLQRGVGGHHQPFTGNVAPRLITISNGNKSQPVTSCISSLTARLRLARMAPAWCLRRRKVSSIHDRARSERRHHLFAR